MRTLSLTTTTVTKRLFDVIRKMSQTDAATLFTNLLSNFTVVYTCRSTKQFSSLVVHVVFADL